MGVAEVEANENVFEAALSDFLSVLTSQVKVVQAVVRRGARRRSVLEDTTSQELPTTRILVQVIQLAGSQAAELVKILVAAQTDGILLNICQVAFPRVASAMFAPGGMPSVGSSSMSDGDNSRAALPYELVLGKGSASYLSGHVLLSWTVYETEAVFSVQGKAEGWVGVGLSFDGLMLNSDIVIGLVNEDGTMQVDDYFTADSRSLSCPTGVCLDTTAGGENNIVFLGGSQKRGITSYVYKRRLVTGDKFDREITGGLLHVIVALGKTNNLGYHAAMKASSRLQLINYPRLHHTIRFLANGSINCLGDRANDGGTSMVDVNPVFSYTLDTAGETLDVQLQGRTSGYLSVAFSLLGSSGSKSFTIVGRKGSPGPDGKQQCPSGSCVPNAFVYVTSYPEASSSFPLDDISTDWSTGILTITGTLHLSLLPFNFSSSAAVAIRWTTGPASSSDISLSPAKSENVTACRLVTLRTGFNTTSKVESLNKIVPLASMNAELVYIHAALSSVRMKLRKQTN